MDKFKELDTVECVDSLVGVPIGTEGTIVFVYSSEIFEVEYFLDGKSIVLATFENQIKKR